ncbi:LPXTG cell wall anchor domain-containing protein [Actinoplanes sp. CA-142083]|uniref:LPXTG cell wall anchor domain-containing protein n=1 Tax=Actinoplanes sp. CA-142083 TaxID=3239903 RepID=UPI003D94E01E
MVFRLIGATLLAASALTIPTAAHAAEAGSGLVPLVEREADGKTVVYPARQGETVPIVLGVKNTGAEALKGIVVNVRVLNEVDLPKEFTNCVYYVDSNLRGAWCSIDAEVAAGGTYKLSPFRVTVSTKAEKISAAVIFQWATLEYAESKGGIEALAKADSGKGTTPAAGAGEKLGLATAELPVPAEPAGVGFAYLKLVTPPTTPPTAVPTTSPAATASSSATAAPTVTATEAGGGGGGLPVTGSKTAAVAGIGALLLVAGAVGVLLVRRRRTRFVA